MRYGWKANSRVVTDANVAGAEIERIRAKYKGFFTPGVVAEEQRPEDMPLHNEFTWDNEVAGQLRRLDEARYIINHLITIEETVDPNYQESTQAYVSIRVEDEGGHRVQRYTTVDIAIADPDMRGQLLDEAIREVRSFARRYSMVPEMAGVIQAIGRALAQLDRRIAIRHRD